MCTYSKFLLIQLTWDWTNYQIFQIIIEVPILCYILTGDYLLLLLYLGFIQPIRGALHLDISFICWLRVIEVLFSVSGVIIAEEVDGVDRQGVRRYHDSSCTSVHVLQTICFSTAIMSKWWHMGCVCGQSEFFVKQNVNTA